MSDGPEVAASPRSLAELRTLLAEQPELLPVAGGTDLMVADPLERSAAGRVVDLTRVPELRGVAETADGGLEIGAATPFSELRRHPLVRARYPALAAAAAVVGGWQIQNRATVGGNVASRARSTGRESPAGLALATLPPTVARFWTSTRPAASETTCR